MMKKILLILLCFPLFLLAQPTITNISPTMGLVGSSVTIHGSGFSTTTLNNTVFFGGIEATIVSNTSTAIIVTVPNSIPYAPISVYTDSLVSVSSELFNVLFTTIAPLQASDLSNQLYNPYIGQKYNDVKMADMNGDGTPEIVTSESGEGSSAYLAIFKTSFDSQGLMSIDDRLEINFGTGVYSVPQDIAIGDVNGDGLLDVVVSEKGDVTDDFQAHTCIFINNSQDQNFSFEPPIIIPGEGYEGFVQLQDINGDGKLDIVTSREAWNQLGIYLNTSINNDVSFANKLVIPEAIGTRPAFSDLNGDGLVDMVATIYGGTNNNRDVNIYSNNSTVSNINFILEDSVLAGGFPAPGSNDWNWSSSYPTLVDLDGDDKLDIVVTNGNCGFGCSPSGISVIRNISSGSALNFDYNYSDWYQYQTNTWPLRTNVSDLNGDGKPDLLTNDWGGGISILVNSSTLGNISLNSQLQLGVGSFPRAIATSDLNMDVSPEIVVANFEVEGLRIIHNFIPSILATEDNSSLELSTYPNPTKGIVTISAQQEINNVTVYNILGQEVKSVSGNGNSVTVNLSEFATGHYIAKVVAGDSSESIKIIKQ